MQECGVKQALLQQPLRRWANTLGRDAVKFGCRGVFQGGEVRSSQAAAIPPQVRMIVAHSRLLSYQKAFLADSVSVEL